MATQTFRSKLVVGLASLALLGAAAQAVQADDNDRSRGRGDRGNGNYARQDDRGNRGNAERSRGSEQRYERRGGDTKFQDNRSRGGNSNYQNSRSGGDDGKYRYDNRRGDDGKHHQSYQRYDDGKYRQSYQRYDDGKRYYGGNSYYDSRWQHYRSYPRRGYVTYALPRNVVVVRHRHYNYWYGGGAWYAPYGASFMVVAPPLGVFVSLLPSFYTTLWFGGIPYYYANDAYYVWRDYRRAYEVVEPPPGARVGSTSPATDDIFVYPGAGQGEEQVASDRYDCHRWASDETGFDPTRPEGGVPSDEVQVGRSEYMRAMTACLEGRGYSVT